MDWNTIVLKFIEGPGLGFTAMVLGFFALIAILASVKATTRRQDAFREGMETRRAGDLDMLKGQLARVVDEQREITNKLPAPRPKRRTSLDLNAEIPR